MLSIQSERNIDLLTIGSGERHIVVMARVHPGESPASFIMEGFLEFITSEDCNVAKESDRHRFNYFNLALNRVLKILSCY